MIDLVAFLLFFPYSISIMKLMIASDIHGSSYYAERMFKAYQSEQAQRLILLGDLLYHGPRNDLPKDYCPKEVIPMLNSHAEEILCVRGNCEAEVDQMVLTFPIMADYSTMFLPELDGRMLFITHGHLFNDKTLPPIKKGDILLHGHTHIPVAEDRDDYILLNPGSVALPKGGYEPTYMVYDTGRFTIKDFTGRVIKELIL